VNRRELRGPRLPEQPIFQGNRIKVQYVRTCQPTSAARLLPTSKRRFQATRKRTRSAGLSRFLLSRLTGLERFWPALKIEQRGKKTGYPEVVVRRATRRIYSDVCPSRAGSQTRRKSDYLNVTGKRSNRAWRKSRSCWRPHADGASISRVVTFGRRRLASLKTTLAKPVGRV
jgi:hypothetical protein